MISGYNKMTNIPDEQIYLIIGGKIKEARDNLKVSQTELAKRISIARTSLSNIESGKQKLPIHLLYKIASALGIPVTALLPGIGEQETDIKSLLNQKIVINEQGTGEILKDQEKERILDLISSQGDNH